MFFHNCTWIFSSVLKSDPRPPLGGPKTPPVLGSPDFSILFHRSIGLKFGIRVLLMIVHAHFSRFLNRTPALPLGGLQSPQFWVLPIFHPFPIVRLGQNLVYVFFSSMPMDICWFSLSVIFLLIFLEMLTNCRCCFRCTHRWRWRFPGRCAIASVHEMRVPFLDWSFEGNFFLNLLLNCNVVLLVYIIILR